MAKKNNNKTLDDFNLSPIIKSLMGSFKKIELPKNYNYKKVLRKIKDERLEKKYK